MPYLRRYRSYHLPEDSEILPEVHLALSPFHRSSVKNLPYFYRYLQAFSWKFCSDVPQYIAWQQLRHRRQNQSFRGRLPADIWLTSPEPYLPVLRRWSCLHVDDIYPWYHRQYVHIYGAACQVRYSVRSWNTKLFAAPASDRLLHPAMHVLQ